MRNGEKEIGGTLKKERKKKAGSSTRPECPSAISRSTIFDPIKPFSPVTIVLQAQQKGRKAGGGFWKKGGGGRKERGALNRVAVVVLSVLGFSLLLLLDDLILPVVRARMGMREKEERGTKKERKKGGRGRGRVESRLRVGAPLNFDLSLLSAWLVLPFWRRWRG